MQQTLSEIFIAYLHGIFLLSGVVIAIFNHLIYRIAIIFRYFILLLTYLPPSFSFQPAGIPVNVTLSIVREQGSSGELAIYYQTRPALYKPPSNQATAGIDYLAKDDTVIMINGADVAFVNITILPVRMCR